MIRLNTIEKNVQELLDCYINSRNYSNTEFVNLYHTVVDRVTQINQKKKNEESITRCRRKVAADLPEKYGKQDKRKVEDQVESFREYSRI